MNDPGTRRLIPVHCGMDHIAAVDGQLQVGGKSLSVQATRAAMRSGSEITMAPFNFDTASSHVFKAFEENGGFSTPGLAGSPNVIMVPDPRTFRVLPWTDKTGWVLCDLYMKDGTPFERIVQKKMATKPSARTIAARPRPCGSCLTWAPIPTSPHPTRRETGPRIWPHSPTIPKP